MARAVPEHGLAARGVLCAGGFNRQASIDLSGLQEPFPHDMV